MSLTAAAALWFLPFAAPVALWAAWRDMKTMRIPNRTVLALAGVFLVIGPLALPLDTWLGRWLHLAVVLAVGFVASSAGMVGAGDAKFAAAMAPFVARGDTVLFLYLLAAAILAALLTHRGARRLGAVRRLAPDWASWRAADFPMGLALGGALVLYLGLGVVRGA